ncbi:MAG TPA: sugar nucleotide-binding protein [Jatrophihabitans sp.]|nr:sugar nucleotide-binding protein [Jatrophihabitans sp.]
MIGDLAEHSAVPARTLVVGAGLIGTPIIETLRALGSEVRSVCRSARPEPHLRADLSTPAGRSLLAETVEDWQPDRVVLVHGPGDVTWMEDNEESATSTHVRTARIVSGRPTVLISTDNVFPGSAGCHPDTAVVRPHNAYGRVKFAAEQALADCPAAVIMRVSMVFGPRRQGRTDFVNAALERAAAGQEFTVPTDQHLTPVYLDDVTTAVVAVLLAPPRPLTLHLAGPTQLSRYELARAAYRAAGAEPDLVRGVPRAQTSWACRPAYSSLSNSDYSGFPGLHDWLPRDVPAALSDLVLRNSA